MRADLVIAGGGPAGLAVAIEARLRGMDVIVLERRTLPLDKACGEGLMPGGVEALREMGVEIDDGASMPFEGIRFIDGDCVARAFFAAGTGRGIRRTRLVQAMRSRALALGAQLCDAARVLDYRPLADGEVRVSTTAGDVSARLLVAADGLHSPLRLRAGLAAPSRGPLRHGVRRHYRIGAASPFVDVHWAEGVEAYVTPVAPEEIGVALLWSGGPARFDPLLARLPALADRLRGAEATSDARGASSLHQRARRRFAPGIALVGDAAGFVDAISGEGLTLAFRSARLLAETLARGEALDAYERGYRAISRTYYGMTRLLVAIGGRPGLRRRMVHTLARHPDVFDALLALNAGQGSLRGIGLAGAAHLLGGLLLPDPLRGSPARRPRPAACSRAPEQRGR